MVEAAVLNEASEVRTDTAEAAAPAAAAEGRPLRLLVLAPKPAGLSPGQRFRLEQWAPILKERHGIALDFLPFESARLTQLLYKRGHLPQKALWTAWDFLRRLKAVIRARRYDGVVIYREVSLIGPAIYERALATLKVPIFYDFDDAIWHPGHQISPANGIFSRLHFWGKTGTICRLSSAVLPGNEYLAAYARERNDRVFVLPTSIDLSTYPVIPEPPMDEGFIVCWTGSTTTLVNFEHARPALERLAKMRKLVVKVICNEPPKRSIEGAKNVFVPWQERGEAEEIGASHAGIMPLPDDEYLRGKCGLKGLQYMATGRPVVLSPVGMNSALIRNGENGFLASTEDEWVEALTRLAESKDLRAGLGAAARRTVEERYSAEVVAAKCAEAIRSVLS